MNIENLIKQHVNSGTSSAISVGLVDEEDIRFLNYGKITKESEVVPTNNTVYEIGSITKTFTAILATVLEQKGIISLEKPIINFLPEFQNSDFDKKKINLFHLLTHTSGISEFSVGLFASQMFSLMITGRSQVKEYNYDLDTFLKYASNLKLKDEPGTTFRYSNVGFGLAGKILERITNKTYDDLVRIHICDELGMRDTGINILESHKDQLATGHSFRNKEIGYWDVPAIESAGSLRSTTEDMVKFLEVALGLKETSLSSAFAQCQQTKMNPHIPPTMKFFTRSFGISLSTFRLGWFVFPQENIGILGHDGGTAGFSSFMAMNPERKSGVIILTNRAMKPVHKLGLDLLKKNKIIKITINIVNKVNIVSILNKYRNNEITRMEKRFFLNLFLTC